MCGTKKNNMNMSKKVKVNYVRWELTPVYNELYIDEKQLKEISEIECEDERMEYLEDILGNSNEFIWTGNWETGDELDKFYIKNNEHSLYVSSVIEIDNNVVVKDFNTSIEKDINEIFEEYKLLEVYDVNSIIRDRKINNLLD